jgi:hypothetical protein
MALAVLSIKNINGPELSYPTPKKIYKFKGAFYQKILAFENRSYLGEFEAEFKKALARLNQGPMGYCLMKKKKS